MIGGIDVERVSQWLDVHVDEVEGPFTFEPITGGRSNLTFTVTGADGRLFVLRRPPLGEVLESAHDMVREHRIISAVATTSVPVPRPLGLCIDPAVTGAPFYVMDHVTGVVLDAREKAVALSVAARRTASEHLFDVLADLHAVDVDHVGLGSLAKRTGYVDRQLARWRVQWERSKTRELPVVVEVADRLSERVPEQRDTSIAHGDYRFGNCLTDPASGRIAAVLDWELCTLGDPLADVGYLGVYWTDPGAAGGRDNDPTAAEGFGTYDELVERYARRSGRDVSQVDFYRAFSAWRMAVISEGVYARYLHGAMGAAEDVDERELARFRDGTEELAVTALDAIGRLP